MSARLRRSHPEGAAPIDTGCVGDTRARAREAIIIIHGMGEQHRNETLRDFVGVGAPAATLTPPAQLAGNARFDVADQGQLSEVGSGIAGAQDMVYANPSPLPDHGLQVYTIRWNSERGRKSDVFEVYWAPHFRDTKITAVLSWAARLIVRRRDSVSTVRLLGDEKRAPVAVQIALGSWLLFAFAGALASWPDLVLWRGEAVLAFVAAVAVTLVVLVIDWWRNRKKTRTVIARRWLLACGVIAGIAATVAAAALISPVLVEWQRGTQMLSAGLGWFRFTWVYPIGIWVTLAVLLVGFGLLCWSGYCGLQAMIRCTAMFVVLIALSAVWWALLYTSMITSLIALITGPIVMFAVVRVGAVVAKSLGDVVRYLSTAPDDVLQREAIQAQARDLILQLTDLTYKSRPAEYRYRRISVVGHSLGSVVAYDAVNQAWRARHNSIPVPATFDISTPYAPVHALQEAVAARYEDLKGDPAYRRWIVTDLVTLACPLAHAEAVLASSKEGLENMFKSGELLSKPPRLHEGSLPDDAAPTPEALSEYLRRSEVSDRTLFHHRAMFAMVRWHNMYFAHDIVGGPIGVQPADNPQNRTGFGSGVHNRELGDARWMWKMLTQFPHTTYWTVSTKKALKEPSKESIDQLRNILQSL